MLGFFKKKDKDLEEAIASTINKLEEPKEVPQQVENSEQENSKRMYHIHLSNGRLIKAVMDRELLQNVGAARPAIVVTGHDEEESIIEKIIYLDQITHITIERK
jgi:hypothetical protein